MNNKTNKFNWKVLLAILAIIIFNILFLMLLGKVRRDSYKITIITVDVLLTLLALLMTRGLLKNKKTKELNQTKNNEFIQKVKLPEVSELIVYEEQQETKEEYKAYVEDLEVTNLEIQKPKRIIQTKPIYNKKINMLEYVEELEQYFLDHGLQVSKKLVREVLAALTVTKSLIFKNENNQVAKYFIEVLSNFIGANADFITHKDIITDLNYIMNSETAFRLLTSAQQSEEKLHILTISNINEKDDLSYMKELSQYILDANVDELVSKELNNKYSQFPKNIWFLFTTNSKINTRNYPLLGKSITISLDISLTTPKEEVIENSMKLSYTMLLSSIDKNISKYLLEEFYWKHFDKLEGVLKENTDIRINNYTLNLIERYTAYYQIYGGELLEAVDTAIVTIILPMITQDDFIKFSSNKLKLSGTFEDIFGLKKINQTVAILDKIERQN
ncbi:hypothetical protein [Acholeplasma palmae]|nr:hypothetical protein [Alteracholeplasma palmae]